MTVHIRVLRPRADQAVTSAVPYAALFIRVTVIQGTLLVVVSHLIPPSNTDPQNFNIRSFQFLHAIKALLMKAVMLESKRHFLFLYFVLTEQT